MPQWSKEEWKAWKSRQDWTPPRNRGQTQDRGGGSKRNDRDEKKKEAVKEEVRVIRKSLEADLETTTVEEPKAEQQAVEPTKRTAEQVEKRRQLAQKLRATVALRKTLTQSKEAGLAQTLDQEAAELRRTLREDQPVKEVEEEAIEMLAKARVSLDRAAGQVSKACEQRDLAETEVKRCEDLLEEIQDQKATAAKANERMASSVMSMAGLLGDMRAKAQWTEQSDVVLPPSMLDQLATLVAKIASDMQQQSQQPQQRQQQIAAEPLPSVRESPEEEESGGADSEMVPASDEEEESQEEQSDTSLAQAMRLMQNRLGHQDGSARQA